MGSLKGGWFNFGQQTNRTVGGGRRAEGLKGLFSTTGHHLPPPFGVVGTYSPRGSERGSHRFWSEAPPTGGVRILPVHVDVPFPPSRQRRPSSFTIGGYPFNTPTRLPLGLDLRGGDGSPGPPLPSVDDSKTRDHDWKEGGGET